MAKLLAGAAKACITPTNDLMPALSNFNILLEGVYSDLYVRALVFDNGERKIAMITYDAPDMSRTNDIRNALEKNCGLDPININFAATHSHEAPTFSLDHHAVIADPKIYKWAKQYGDFIIEQTIKCVSEAISTMRPARYGLAKGNSYINVNRDQLFEDGLWGQGRDFDGASDKTLSVLKVEDYDGKLIAAYSNYAVHGTCCFLKKDEKNAKFLIAGDLPGIESQYLEERYKNDGAVFLWTSGAAGNQNPIFFCQYQKYNHDKSHELAYDMGYGAWALCEHLAQTQAVDIIRLLGNVPRMKSTMNISIIDRVISLPGQKLVFEDKDANGPGKHIGGRGKYTIEDADPIELKVRLLTLDDYAYIGMNCELCCEIGIRLKEAVPLKDAMIVTHTEERVGYMPDKEGYDKRTVEFYTSSVKDGVTEEYLTPVVLEMFDERFKSK